MNRTRSPIMFTTNEKQEPTDLHNVILLSDWVTEDIIQAKETRRKWVNLYYGPNFDPAAVIGRYVVGLDFECDFFLVYLKKS